MTMESSKAYFNKCKNCKNHYAQHVNTIEFCEPCVEIFTENFWGIGVPTE